MAKMLQFTISGSYYNSKKETFDFENLVGLVPMCDEENGVGSMHVRGRYAEKWVRQALDKKGERLYPERCETMRQVFIDDVKTVETKEDLSFAGKDIKELSVDEMQDLATAKDIRFIPLPNSGMSLREARIRAYVGYMKVIKGKDVKYQAEGFNFAKLPAIILDGVTRVDTTKKMTNDEVLEDAMRQGKPHSFGEKPEDDPRSRWSLKELKELAEQKGFDYDEEKADDVLFDELYNKFYGNAQAAA